VVATAGGALEPVREEESKEKDYDFLVFSLGAEERNS
jgi:hypothetical protein